MGLRRNLTYAVTFVATAAFIVSCSNGGGQSEATQKLLSSYSPQPANLRLSLTDAPKQDLKEVNVNVAHMELFLKKGEIQKRLILAQDLGMVNLLSLRNGVLLPMADVDMPDGVEITHIRMVLKGENNHAIRMDDSRCDMQTPSGQQSGIKIQLKTPIVIQSGYRYSMIVDFDAAKSVVIRGNGTCLLKPVIKLLTATRQQIEDDSSGGDDGGSTGGEDTGGDGSTGGDDGTGGSDDGSTGGDGNTNPDEPITDGTDTNVDPNAPTEYDFFDDNGFPIPPEELGFDPYDPSTYPDGITIQDLWMYF